MKLIDKEKAVDALIAVSDDTTKKQFQEYLIALRALPTLDLGPLVEAGRELIRVLKHDNDWCRYCGERSPYHLDTCYVGRLAAELARVGGGRDA